MASSNSATLVNLAPVQASLNGDVLVLSTLSSEQHHQRPLLQPGLYRPALGKPAKLPQVFSSNSIVLATLTVPASWNV